MIAKGTNAISSSLHAVAVAVFVFTRANDNWGTTEKNCRSILYVHYPKTGGSSIASILLKQLPDLSLPPPPEFFRWYHMPAAMQKEYYGDIAFNAAYKIATVRNPYALAVSSMFMVDLCLISNLPENLFPESDCRFFAASWPITQNTTLYHLALRQVFTEYIFRFFPGTGLLDCHDSIWGSMLPPYKNCSQHAWLTDDSDQAVIVDEVHRLEDGGDFMSAKGIGRRACDRNLSSLTSSTVHARPEKAVGRENIQLQMKQGAHYTFNFSSPILQMYTHLQPHKDPFFYYSAATCEAVALAFAKDFSAFHYDPSECLARISQE